MQAAPAGKEGGEGKGGEGVSAEGRGRVPAKGRGSHCLEARGGRSPGLGERQAKEEREAVVHREAAIKKVMEMAEKRAQGDMEERWVEAVKKMWAAEETMRQWEEAEASKKKPVAMKKQAREENVVAGPSGLPGPRLQ